MVRVRRFAIAFTVTALAAVALWAPAAAAGGRVPGDDPADWGQYGHGPEHDGFNPAETLIGPANVAGLIVQWTEQNGPNAAMSDPLVAGSSVFATKFSGSDPSAGSKVEAFDRTTGAPLWTFGLSTARLPHSDGIAAVSGGTAFVGDSYSCGFSCRSHSLYALDAATGAVTWHVQIQKPASNVVVAGSAIFVGDGSDEVALSTANGSELWRKDVRSPTTDATVGGGMVFVAAADMHLHALNASTGAPAWSTPFASTIFADVAYANGAVYVGDGSGSLSALDATTGGILWSIAAGSNGSAQMAVADGRIFFADTAGHLIAVSSTDGHPLWRTKLGVADSGFSYPSVADGVVYAGVRDDQAGTFTLYALRASTGRIRWSDPIAAFTAAISHGMVFASAAPLQEGDRGTLYAFGL